MFYLLACWFGPIQQCSMRIQIDCIKQEFVLYFCAVVRCFDVVGFMRIFRYNIFFRWMNKFRGSQDVFSWTICNSDSNCLFECWYALLRVHVFIQLLLLNENGRPMFDSLLAELLVFIFLVSRIHIADSVNKSDGMSAGHTRNREIAIESDCTHNFRNLSTRTTQQRNAYKLERNEAHLLMFGVLRRRRRRRGRWLPQKHT